MAQTDLKRLIEFIAFWATSRVKRKGQRKLSLPCCIAAWMALRSLSSVALSSTQAEGLYHVIFPSRRGHLYFADIGDISTLH